MSFITSAWFTHLIVLLVGAGGGYWVGKKGVKNVAGDVTVAVKDVSNKV